MRPWVFMFLDIRYLPVGSLSDHYRRLELSTYLVSHVEMSLALLWGMLVVCSTRLRRR